MSNNLNNPDMNFKLEPQEELITSSQEYNLIKSKQNDFLTISQNLANRPEFQGLTKSNYIRNFLRDFLVSIKLVGDHLNMIDCLFKPMNIRQKLSAPGQYINGGSPVNNNEDSEYHDVVGLSISGFLNDFHRMRKVFFLDLVNKLSNNVPQGQKAKFMADYLTREKALKEKLNSYLRMPFKLDEKQTSQIRSELKEFLELIDQREFLTGVRSMQQSIHNPYYLPLNSENGVNWEKPSLQSQNQYDYDRLIATHSRQDTDEESGIKHPRQRNLDPALNVTFLNSSLNQSVPEIRSDKKVDSDKQSGASENPLDPSYNNNNSNSASNKNPNGNQNKASMVASDMLVAPAIHHFVSETQTFDNSAQSIRIRLPSDAIRSSQSDGLFINSPVKVANLETKKEINTIPNLPSIKNYSQIGDRLGKQGSPPNNLSIKSKKGQKYQFFPSPSFKSPHQLSSNQSPQPESITPNRVYKEAQEKDWAVSPRYQGGGKVEIKELSPQDKAINKILQEYEKYQRESQAEGVVDPFTFSQKKKKPVLKPDNQSNPAELFDKQTEYNMGIQPSLGTDKKNYGSYIGSLRKPVGRVFRTTRKTENTEGDNRSFVNMSSFKKDRSDSIGDELIGENFRFESQLTFNDQAKQEPEFVSYKSYNNKGI